MATILREAFKVDQYRRPYLQVDPAPNLPTTFFSKVKPFTSDSATLPDRFWPRPAVQDFSQTGVTTQGIPTQPRDPRIFRAPTWVTYQARPYQQFEQQPSLILKTLIASTAPFVPPNLPEVPYRRADRDFLVLEGLSYLPGPVIAPYIPVDFPTPMRARANPQDFFFSSTGISPLAPFNQEDWPIPLKLRLHHQDFWWTGVTTRGIPAGVASPFQQDDWPVPVTRKWAQAESYDSPQILLITPVLRPFSQSDFQNPAKYRTIPIDWPWAGVTTRGIPPVPPPSGPFDAVVLEGYSIGLSAIELHWSASAGAHGYRIYINGVPQATELHDRIAIVTGLAIDTQYVFHVVCVNAFGQDASILSDPVYFEHGSNEIGTVQPRPWTNAGTLQQAPTIFTTADSTDITVDSTGIFTDQPQ